MVTIYTSGQGRVTSFQDMAGQTVERISVDHALTLLTDRGSELRISSQFHVRTESGDVFSADPEQPGDFLSKVVLAMLHVSITSSRVLEDLATISVDFVNGGQIVVPFDPDYEAWTLTTPRGGRLVAGVGGGVHVWQEI